MFKVYQAMSGGEDGRGGAILGYFKTYRDAHLATKGRGFYEEYGLVREIEVWEDFRDYEDNKPEVVRKRALAKLTAEERKVLGI
jgi:hypothetical protein